MSDLYTWAELQALPTLYDSHDSELKIEITGSRVWVTRDPDIHSVSIERLREGRWENVSTYIPADAPEPTYD